MGEAVRRTRARRAAGMSDKSCSAAVGQCQDSRPVPITPQIGRAAPSPYIFAIAKTWGERPRRTSPPSIRLAAARRIPIAISQFTTHPPNIQTATMKWWCWIARPDPQRLPGSTSTCSSTVCVALSCVSEEISNSTPPRFPLWQFSPKARYVLPGFRGCRADGGTHRRPMCRNRRDH